MTALATAPPAASWAPPLALDKDAAVDSAVRLETGVAILLGLLLVSYWWVADGSGPGTSWRPCPWADIDATASYIHGRDAARWLQTRPIHSALVIWTDGTATRMPEELSPK